MKKTVSALLVVGAVLVAGVSAHAAGLELLYEFSGGSDDGSSPFASLTLDSGKLYGMTWAGGDSGLGTIFSMDTNGSNFSLLHEFAGGGDDGEGPQGSLTLGSGSFPSRELMREVSSPQMKGLRGLRWRRRNLPIS